MSAAKHTPRAPDGIYLDAKVLAARNNKGLLIDGRAVPFERIVRCVNAHDELLEALREYVSEDQIAEGYGAGIGGELRTKALALIAKAAGSAS